MKKFFQELFQKILTILTQERIVPIILLSSSLFFILIFLSFNISLFPEVNSFSLTSSEPEPKHLRNLETTSNNDTFTDIIHNTNISEFNNSLYNNKTEEDSDETIVITIKRKKYNITEKLLYYEFIKTISTGFYYGDWENLILKKNKFKESNGEGYIYFFKKNDKNYITNLGNISDSSRIVAYLTLKDGEYIDNYIELNFTFTLEDIQINDLNNDSISLILYDVPISYSWEEYIDSGKVINLNHSFINLTFYKKFRQFQNYMEYKLTSNDYGNMSLEISNSTDIKYAHYAKNISSNIVTIVNINNISEDSNINDYNDNDVNDLFTYENNFQLSFKAIAYGSKFYSKKTLDYSIFITICSIIEIYLSGEFTKEVTNNDQLALNTDLYTILFHIMWTSMICGANFFMSLTRTHSSQEYGMPSFCYFALFSIFLLRVLFLAWRARNRDITNMRLFRKKLLKFYLFFYIFLFVTLISIKIWYSYFICTIFLIGSTWIGQIIYSARKGTKPPMSYSYILSASFSKISICFYLKAYKNNIFGYRPNYLKTFIVISIIIIEAFVLMVQKFFGAKFIIPKKFRVQGHNYYRTANEISAEEKEVECVICLDKLKNLNNNDEDYFGDNISGNMISRYLRRYLEYLKKKSENKGDYMITPCHHLFHKRCLEHWLNVKNQCPYCRQQIPPIEEF